MKFVTLAPLFVAATLAQIDGNFGPNCGLRDPSLDEFNDQGGETQLKLIAQQLLDINATTTSLNASINSLDPANLLSFVDLQTGSQDLINQLIQSNATVATIAPLPNDDSTQGNAFNLNVFAKSLSCNVNRTVDNFIGAKSLIVDACLGPIALQQITTINTDGNDFTDSVIAVLPEGILMEAIAIVSPIRVALASGVAAYADQTTLPASCQQSTTTTGAGTATTTGGTTGPTTGPTTGGGVYPTTTGGAVYPTTTGGAVYPTTTEDCEDEPTTTKGAVHPTTTDDECEDDETTTPGAVYTTKPGDVYTTAPGGVYTTGKPTTKAPVYTTVTYDDDECEDDVPTTTKGGNAGSSYTTGRPPVYTTGVAPVYTTPVAPAPTSAPVGKPSTTTGSIKTYAGAAVANDAGNGLGAIAFVAAIVAAL